MPSSLSVRRPIAHRHGSHSTRFKSGHPGDPGLLVFSGFGGHTHKNILTTICHLWTLHFSRNLCQLRASLKILVLRGQPPFNQGLITVFCLLNIFSSRKIFFTLWQMRTSSTPQFKESLEGSGLTTTWEQREKSFSCVFLAVWKKIIWTLQPQGASVPGVSEVGCFPLESLLNSAPLWCWTSARASGWRKRLSSSKNLEWSAAQVFPL